MIQDSGAVDPRHQKRVKVMQKLFAQSFQDQDLVEDSLANKIFESQTKLDKIIQEFAPERPLKDINKVDLAILRLIVFESMNKKTPKKVLINEAVELAKEFGSDGSPKLVNGVLGKLFEKQLQV